MKSKLSFASSGNKGEKVRSDCCVTIELANKGGNLIDLKSKVKALYGRSIIDLAGNILNHFGINDAKVLIEDSGALPFVIAARIEAAIKQLIDTDKIFIEFPGSSLQSPASDKDRNRITRLYIPGNTPSLMINAGIHKPDGIILDLEDAVAIDKKPEARFLVRNALRSLNFYSAEKMVRINQLPMGLEDLEYIIPHNVNLILIPKCESPDTIIQINKKIKELRTQNSELKTQNNDIWLMPIIESSLGVLKSYEIACSAENIVAMAIGLEDYTADLGVKRTNEGTESLFARSMVVNACKAAGIQAIDSVFSDVSDMEALRLNVLKSKALGFDGMGCIHPRQIKVIHDNFAPDNEEIEKALKIVEAFEEAKKKGLGVVSLGTKMIDAPIVKRAIKTIELAKRLGKLKTND
jgi:citrate lyase subunit beta / citryl-CoA lyase